MSATEILRRMLDECGVEWTYGYGTVSYKSDSHWCNTWEHGNGMMCVSMGFFTPEQAIAATLGRGECKPMTYDNGYLMDHIEPGEYYEFWEPACACSECGELIPMRKFCPNCGAKIVAPTTNDVDGKVDA